MRHLAGGVVVTLAVAIAMALALTFTVTPTTTVPRLVTMGTVTCASSAV
jgi:hypothetical protein